MTIQGVDGKVYKISGPNPMMNEQNFWDADKLTKINFHWETIVEADHKKSINQQILEVIAPPTVQLQQEPEPVAVQEEPASIPKEELVEVLEKHKVVFQCLPVFKREVHDDLYDTTFIRTTYGEKFSFPGIIVDRSDLQLVFWTDQKLPEKSIVFPNDSLRRWWKIQNAIENDGGYLVTSVVSDLNPDFS